MILNLTQHVATVDQTVAGVVEPKCKADVQKYLTFNAMPSREEIEERAELLAALASHAINAQRLSCNTVMIAGAPYLMAALEVAIKDQGLVPVYAYSERISVEMQNDDGSVTKTNQFKHMGFIPA